MLRYRGDAGLSPPAAGHTSLQTRAHGAAGGSAADHTRGAVRSECLGLCWAFPRALQVLAFFRSKAVKGPPSCKAGSWFDSPVDHLTCGREVLFLIFV